MILQGFSRFILFFFFWTNLAGHEDVLCSSWLYFIIGQWIDRQRCCTVIHETVDTRYGKDEGRQNSRCSIPLKIRECFERFHEENHSNRRDGYLGGGREFFARSKDQTTRWFDDRTRKLDRLLRRRVVIFAIRKEK